MAKFVHSKENRNNLRLINISLLCTLDEGLLLFHQTYEGNTQDAKHFKGIISKITNIFQLLQKEVEGFVLVFDKGNHSLNAFQSIEKLNVPFIASVKSSSHKDLLGVSLCEFTEMQLRGNKKVIKYY